MKLNKKSIAVSVGVVLLVLSLGYVIWDLYNKTRISLFNSGYAQAVSDMIDQAENEQCAPFPIFFEERQVQLINVQCLNIGGGEPVEEEE